jgi:alpha/beta superfamily hydrolase
LFGYSLGGAVALVVASEQPDLDAVAALAPAASLPDGSDATEALRRIDVPTLVVHGERDEVVDWQPVVDAAQERGHRVESVPADHHFVGQSDTIGTTVAPFLAKHL